MKLGTALLVLSAVIMSSCRSTRDVNVRIEVDSSAVYSPDSSAIYFVAHTAAWTKGKPFWFIMPVEGRSRYLYDNLSLYLYRIGEQRLSPIFDLGRIPYALSGWKIQLVPAGSPETEVSMTIQPLQGWDASALRQGVPEMRERLDKVFVIDSDGRLSRAAAHFPGDMVKKAKLADLNSIVRTQPYAAFGLELKKIDPAAEEKYIKTLTSLANTTEYRRLVIEQVVSRKDRKTIRRIYGEMKKSLDRLSGQARADMEWRTRENFEMRKG